MKGRRGRGLQREGERLTPRTIARNIEDRQKGLGDFPARSSERSPKQQRGASRKNGGPLFLAHQRIAAVRAGKGRDERATPARPCLRCRSAEETPCPITKKRGLKAKTKDADAPGLRGGRG